MAHSISQAKIARHVAVRPATPADVPVILSMIRELAEYEKAPDQVVATPELLHQHLFGAGTGRGPIAECVMGEIDGQTQGYALFFMNYSTWTGRPGVYLEDLYVRPSSRRCGLGRALLTRLAAIAVERGCARFEWSVLDWNTPALDFYRSLGALPMLEWTVQRVAGDALARLAAEGAKIAQG